MRAVADALWDAFSGAGYSWCGFYTIAAGGEGEEMILGPSRDTPACSPIGLHGVSGLGYRSGAAIGVPDIRTLGERYVACDPRDMSEVVVPMLAGPGGVCIGVIDIDSRDVDAFTDEDAGGLSQVMEAAGLATPGAELSIVHR